MNSRLTICPSCGASLKEANFRESVVCAQCHQRWRSNLWVLSLIESLIGFVPITFLGWVIQEKASESLLLQALLFLMLFLCCRYLHRLVVARFFRVYKSDESNVP
jgi:biotin transporter BioY